MSALLRLIGLLLALLGLANLYMAKNVTPVPGNPFIIEPGFNAWVFLGLALIMFLMSLGASRQAVKVGKVAPNKKIDPKNEVRLRELKALRGRRLVGGKEYKEKRAEILKGL